MTNFILPLLYLALMFCGKPELVNYQETRICLTTDEQEIMLSLIQRAKDDAWLIDGECKAMNTKLIEQRNEPISCEVE